MHPPLRLRHLDPGGMEIQPISVISLKFKGRFVGMSLKIMHDSIVNPIPPGQPYNKNTLMPPCLNQWRPEIG